MSFNCFNGEYGHYDNHLFYGSHTNILGESFFYHPQSFPAAPERFDPSINMSKGLDFGQTANPTMSFSPSSAISMSSSLMKYEDLLSGISLDNSRFLYDNSANMSENSVLMKSDGGKGKKKTNSLKGQWNPDEDRLLVALVEKHGLRRWSHIAQMLEGRIGKQCRERWHNHLRPDIKKDTWTEEEDRILIEAHSQIGNKWAEIVKRLPGRTENSVKNHWNATKRKQLSRKRCRTSKNLKPSTLLQDYIKNLAETANSTVATEPAQENDVMNVAQLFEQLGCGNEGNDQLLYGWDGPMMVEENAKNEMDLMEMIRQNNYFGFM